ncbi:MAG: histidinol dehydrogenase [Opitutaceae bacterium]|jgi:histidinol dehydrogenase|nr:histidinol dehydrogenase [Opitutaceae bacterium]
MRTLSISGKTFSDDLAAFCNAAAPSPDIAASVAAILADVRARGDEAIAYYAAKFDGAKLRAREFRVPPGRLAGAAKKLPAAERKAIGAAHENILAYNRKGLPKGWMAKNKHGAEVGEKFDPIRRVGLYIPGGQVPLVSTVLMTATMAKIAGCPQIAAFTPSDPSGKVSPALLAALHIAGVDEVYRIGGVQAIGAMAHGTATIPAVDKIFGPGNAYVCEAKRQVFGAVGVDSLPGPSEVMVIADETARADFVAADILAQAEHGSGREKIYLVATSQKIIDAVSAEIQAQLKFLTRLEKIHAVLASGFLAIEAPALRQIADIANYVAPEHLELIVKDASGKKLLRDITTAGAIFLGNHTPTALGDFTAGPSHVLPTARTSRFSSGLRTVDFMRRTSIVRYGPASVKKGSEVTAVFAAMEKLDAHGRSVSIRV